MHLNTKNRIAAAAMLAAALALGARAGETPYNVAVLPAWKNWGHVHDFDWVFKSLGYDWTNCVESAEQIEWLDRNLEKFDLLVAPPLFHYEKGKAADPEYNRPYNMDKLGPHIAKWIQEGGCFLGVDMNYPMAMEWYGKMDPLMEISACVDPSDMATAKKCNNFGPPVLEDNDSMLYFPRSVEPGFCWGHMVIPPAHADDTAWKTIATCGHGRGFPTLVVRRWGKGIIVLSSTRSYVSELIQNIRVNQRFAQFGVAVTDSDMPDPIPGRNGFAFSCLNSSDKAFAGELELTLFPRIPNPDKDTDNPKDKVKPGFIDDPDKSHWFVAKAADKAEPQSAHAFRLECDIPLRGDVRAVMRFRSGDTEAVVFDRLLTLPELFAVSGPPYRGIVSVARRFKDVTFTTQIYPFKEKLDELTVDLGVKNAAGDVVASASFPAEQGKTFHKVALPLSLSAGKYTIDGTLATTSGGKVVATSTAELDIMPNGPGYAAFDEDNTLIVEGEPFLPLGIYHPRDKEWSFEGFRDVADVGFNVVNLFGWMGVSRLDILRSVDVSCLWEQLPHRLPVLCMEHSWTLNYHPSALLNYTIDEPAESQFSQVRKLDEAWRKYDPYHPTFLASYQPHHFRRNAAISDILAPDPYPYNPIKGEDSDIPLVARRVEMARAASDGVNPVFCVPQAMGDVPPYIWRNMGLQAIVHGAKGIIWYAWNEGHDGPWGGLVWDEELLAEAEIFLAQLKLLAPAILGDAANQPRMFTLAPGREPVWKTLLGSRNVAVEKPYDDETVLHGMVCRDPKKGTRYLILVNTSKEPFSCELKVAEADKAAHLEGAFGEGALAVSNGVVKVELGKFGSGVWYWDGPKPAMPRPMSDFAVRELPRRGSGKVLDVASGGAYTNLQDAIDAAEDGDVLHVAEGYWGPIVSDNKLIDIVATGARSKTFIRSKKGGRPATLTQRPQGRMNFETNTLLRGFTIQGGDSATDPFRPKYGGGVIGGTLVDCIVQNNKARYGGGAAFANAYNCIFRGNSASFNGGAASLCKAYDSLFEGNSAKYDGGAAEFCELETCTFRKNKAGRNGGGATSGRARFCSFFDNDAGDRGGGLYRSETANSLFVRNHATNNGGATAQTDPSFCTVAYNTITRGTGTGIAGRASHCLLVHNSCKEDPLAYQVLGYHNGTGEGNWYVSSTNNYPSSAPTFTLDAFVDPKSEDYRITQLAPFIDSVTTKYVTRDEKDLYGGCRLSGGGMEPGAAELPAVRQVFYNIDPTKASPFASTVVSKPVLTTVDRTTPLPSIENGTLSFAGTNATRSTQIMTMRWPKYRIEAEFRTPSSGPIFKFGTRLNATVTEDGKLQVLAIQGIRASYSNILVSATAVDRKAFNKLVIDFDRFGGFEGAFKAELNGKPVPLSTPFGMKNPIVFTLGQAPMLTLGFAEGKYFTGEIKSFKVTGYTDQ